MKTIKVLLPDKYYKVFKTNAHERGRTAPQHLRHIAMLYVTKGMVLDSGNKLDLGAVNELCGSIADEEE